MMTYTIYLGDSLLYIIRVLNIPQNLILFIKAFTVHKGICFGKVEGRSRSAELPLNSEPLYGYG